MICYSYHPITKELTGKHTVDGEIPANMTELVPMVYTKNEIPLFINGEWKLYKDYRNEMVTNKITKIASSYLEIGDLPDTLTLIACPDKDLYSWKDNGWVQDVELYKARDRKKRTEVLNNNQWIVSRHESEKRLIVAKKKTATTLTEAQILELDEYFLAWRDFMNETWYIGKPYPTKPSFVEV